MPLSSCSSVCAHVCAYAAASIRSNCRQLHTPKVWLSLARILVSQARFRCLCTKRGAQCSPAYSRMFYSRGRRDRVACCQCLRAPSSPAPLSRQIEATPANLSSTSSIYVLPVLSDTALEQVVRCKDVPRIRCSHAVSRGVLALDFEYVQVSITSSLSEAQYSHHGTSA
jgi:hypothetical protein